jgi:energy-converting hydrogenase Eha subunit A
MMKGVNWAGVIAAAIASIAIGFLWYGVVFEAQWLALMNLTPEQTARAQSPTMMVAGMINTAVAAIGLGWLAARTGASGWMEGAKLGLVAGFFFAATTGMLDYCYVGLDPALIPINIGYLLVMYAVAGALVGGVKMPAKSAAAA